MFNRFRSWLRLKKYKWNYYKASNAYHSFYDTMNNTEEDVAWLKALRFSMDVWAMRIEMLSKDSGE